MSSSTYVNLTPGDPAPWFRQRSIANPAFAFDTAAGRYIVLCFFGSAADPKAKAALSAIQSNRALFDDYRASFFGVTVDPTDLSEGRVRELLPGIRFFLDFDRAVSRQYGAIAREAPSIGPVTVRQFSLLLDPALRVVSAFPFDVDEGDCTGLLETVRRLPEPARPMPGHTPTPVLWLPNVFEPELCSALIDVYKKQGSEESGFMRDVAGKTTLVHDFAHKRRRDCIVSDAALIKAIKVRVQRRIASEILKVHHFNATRMERYIVACYTAEDHGHFRSHRDNTTKGTAHRRFAVSINLNDDFEGGALSFPEYGQQSFSPPGGGAVVFSCSLLHSVSAVTKGRRFAFLPFLYDDAAAQLRETNLRFLGEGHEYRAFRESSG
jgi:predicted 2-oxoglutarate/Fe(II)-dependent dioxygenase YbiX/peroxiredoxin